MKVPSETTKNPLDLTVSPFDSPLAKKSKQTVTIDLPPGNFLSPSAFLIEPISFAYPCDFPNSSEKNLLLISEPVASPQAP